MNALRPAGAVVAVALLLCGGGGSVHADEPDWKKSTTRSYEAIEAGGTVRVYNPFGAVYARFGGYEDRVEVQATRQRIEVDQPELDVRLTGLEGDLEVTVVVGGAAADAAPAERRDRIDLVVFVPEGAVLDVETRNDTIEAKGLHGELIARTLKGDISVRKQSGSIRASSERGRIQSTLLNGVTTQPQSFTTRTGDIEIHLREDARFSVDLASSGHITTDFSVDIEHRNLEEPDKRATAVIGEGGPRVSLLSKRGRLYLLRLPREPTGD